MGKNNNSIVHILFSKEHIAKNIGSFFVAALIFYCGVLFNTWRGPTKVVITNQSSTQDTIVVKMEGKKESGQLESKIEKLVNDVGNIKNFIALSKQVELASSGNELPIVVDTAKLISEKGKYSRIPHLSNVKVAQVTQPPFILPSIVKGYNKDGIEPYANVYIPSTSFRKDGRIFFTITFYDSSLLKKITPLFVHLLRKNSNNNFTLLYKQQYTLTPYDNLVVVPANYGIGQYTLEAGFYKITDIEKEFPIFYSASTIVNIADNR